MRYKPSIPKHPKRKSIFNLAPGQLFSIQPDISREYANIYMLLNNFSSPFEPEEKLTMYGANIRTGEILKLSHDDDVGFMIFALEEEPLTVRYAKE